MDYKDWGNGQPIVFSRGWLLSADDWDNQMLFFLKQGYRVIAHDRRGHGRSSQVPDGHDLDHYADDLAAVTAHLDLKNAIHVGHSTGGGEVVRYLARHSDRSFVKAAIISAVPPLMVRKPAQNRTHARAGPRRRSGCRYPCRADLSPAPVSRTLPRARSPTDWAWSDRAAPRNRGSRARCPTPCHRSGSERRRRTPR